MSDKTGSCPGTVNKVSFTMKCGPTCSVPNPNISLTAETALITTALFKVVTGKDLQVYFQ
jgi:hypothetical protein